MLWVWYKALTQSCNHLKEGNEIVGKAPIEFSMDRIAKATRVNPNKKKISKE